MRRTQVLCLVHYYVLVSVTIRRRAGLLDSRSACSNESGPVSARQTASTSEPARILLAFNMAVRGYQPVMDLPGTGYAAIMAEGLQGATPLQVLSVPANFYQKMGLDRVLSSQRLNGISAILAHMKKLALEQLSLENQ